MAFSIFQTFSIFNITHTCTPGYFYIATCKSGKKCTVINEQSTQKIREQHAFIGMKAALVKSRNVSQLRKKQLAPTDPLQASHNI